MFEKSGNDVKKLNIKINPRTEIKLLSNKFEDISNTKYAHIEYQRKQGYILISKIRKYSTIRNISSYCALKNIKKIDCNPNQYFQKPFKTTKYLAKIINQTIPKKFHKKN